MKKGALLTILSLIVFISGCNKVTEIGQQINIDKPLEQQISKSGQYSLDCKSKYYTNSIIGGEIIEESYISTAEGNERDTMYINGESAKFFGADYIVLQDDTDNLIIMRQYEPSGLTETISINKNSGIGFDVKTLTLGMSGGPTSATYILSCTEI